MNQEPTNLSGYPDINNFKIRIKNKPDNLYISFLVCTEDDQDVKYMDSFLVIYNTEYYLNNLLI